MYLCKSKHLDKQLNYHNIMKQVSIFSVFEAKLIPIYISTIQDVGQHAKLGHSIVLKAMHSHSPTKNKGEGFVYPPPYPTSHPTLTTILFIN